ncbi:MAG: hypothetical protein N2445_03915 [Acidobacteria bacterium]|nr:hypothetical protein [Acidobacteriota bacterium]
MAKMNKLETFVIKRVEKALENNDLLTAFHLLHKLDPLPDVFEKALKELDEEELKKNKAYTQRLALKIVMCLDQIKYGCYGITPPPEIR